MIGLYGGANRYGIFGAAADIREQENSNIQRISQFTIDLEYWLNVVSEYLQKVMEEGYLIFYLL